MCQDRLENVQRYINRIRDVYDEMVVVDNGSVDGTREWLLAQSGVTKLLRSWNDSFVGGRNSYLRVIDEIASQDESPLWILVADSDEFFSDGLLEDIRSLCEEAYDEDLNVLRVRALDVETNWNGDIIWKDLARWHKPLVLLWEPGLQYRGIGQSNVHEDLVVPSGRRERNIDSQGERRVYTHEKKHGETWIRGIRNFFAGGGGPNLGELNPLWRPFRQLVADCTNGKVTNAADFVKYLEAGDVAQPILDWFIKYRFLGTEFDSTEKLWDCWPDGTSEIREGFLSFFVLLHPERMPIEFIESDRAYKNYRAEVQTIHASENRPAWAV